MRASRVVFSVLLLGACRRGSAPEARLPAEPASGSSVPSTVAVAGAGALQDAAAPAIDEGMPKLAVVLDDPRLAVARDRDRAGDPSGAARALDTARSTASLDQPTACAWAFVAGRLHLQAGENAEAAAALEQAMGTADDAGSACPLAPYAALREAEALVRAGRQDQAIVRALTVGEDVAAHEEARLTLADAYAAKGDRASAVPVWRALLASSPRGVRWVDSSLQLAGARMQTDALLGVALACETALR